MVSYKSSPFAIIVNDLSSCGSALAMNRGQLESLVATDDAEHRLKIYTRGMDIAVKYWDAEAADWCKFQFTLQERDVVPWLDMFREHGICTVDKNGNSELDLRNTLIDKLKDASFILLVC